MVTNTALFTKNFNMRNIAILQNLGYEVHVAANFDAVSNFNQNGNDSLKSELSSICVKCFQINFGRNEKDLAGIKKCYDELLNIVVSNNYHLMHCHNPIPGVIARLVAKKTDTPIIYTAHGLHFYKGASKINWLLFYPVEKFCSKYTDVMITINTEDYKLAKEKFHAGQVIYIPGVGVETNINDYPINIQAKRESLHIPPNAKLLISVGELNNNKNHQVVIQAIARLHISSIHYLIAGAGKKEQELRKLAQSLHIENQIHFLGYRKDIRELDKISDIFVFPSFREGLSAALMESMTMGKPVVCSDIRGNRDLIDDGKGGFLVNPHSVDEFAEKIKFLLSHPELMQKMGKYNQQKIKRFDCRIVDEKMLEIYREFINYEHEIKNSQLYQV